MSITDRGQLDLTETISALATGSLPCAVAIVRLSGDQAFPFAQRHFRPATGEFRKGRGMWFGDLVENDGRLIDSIVLLGFQGPGSFTGQDVVELQCHGSLAVVHRIEKLLVEHGIRPAQPGEFSWRAYQNERLTAAELDNLGDVFLAQDSSDLDRIYRRADASLQKEIQDVRSDLIRLQAILDTAVDFSEEYSHVVAAARHPLQSAIEKSRAMAQRYEVFAGTRRVPRLVLAGRPNAGKSSLFNALLCRYRAIVHETEGTTRDAIEEDIEQGGRRWKLVDTAGFREALTDTERQGIELGSDFLESATFWVLVVDGTQGLSPAETDLLARFGSKPHLIAWNKKDLPGFMFPGVLSGETVVAASALTGEGIRELASVVEQRAAALAGAASVLPSATQTRNLQSAVTELEAMATDLGNAVTPEIVGEKNRILLRRLETLVGEVGVEDVLDRVFSEFCIGK